jgi:hypothetical protein
MKSKKRLQRHLHGWFPNDINLEVKSGQNSQKAQTCLDVTTMLKIGAIEQRTLQLIMTPLLVAFVTYLLSGVYFLILHSLFASAVLVIGIVAGSASSYVFTSRQLRLLNKKGEMRRSRKATAISCLVTSLISISPLIFLLLLHLPAETLLVFAGFCGSAGMSGMTVNMILNFRWENLNHKRIYNKRGSLYAIPEAKNLQNIDSANGRTCLS